MRVMFASPSSCTSFTYGTTDPISGIVAGYIFSGNVIAPIVMGEVFMLQRAHFPPSSSSWSYVRYFMTSPLISPERAIFISSVNNVPEGTRFPPPVMYAPQKVDSSSSSAT